MKKCLVALAVCLLALCSCATTQTSYESRSDQPRGARSINSDIEMVGEVEVIKSSLSLGVFFSKESLQDREEETILIAARNRTYSKGTFVGGTISLYDMAKTASLNVDNAKRLLSAIDAYLAMDPKSLAPTRMLNSEQYFGILDPAAGTEKQHPFKELTLIAISTVSSSGRFFKIVLPRTTTSFYGQKRELYDTYVLDEKEVSRLGAAITAALSKSTRAPSN
jgi:hypothetical protein